MNNTISAHLPDDWPFAIAYKQRLALRYRTKASPYIVDLVERDLKIMRDNLAGNSPTAEDWHQLIRLDEGVSVAAKIAVAFMRETDPTKKLELGQRMATELLSVVVDSLETNPLAAEAAAPYGGAKVKTPAEELVAACPESGHTKEPDSKPRAAGKAPKTSRAPRP